MLHCSAAASNTAKNAHGGIAAEFGASFRGKRRRTIWMIGDLPGGDEVTREHDEQQGDHQPPARVESNRWQDPGNDDVSLRHEAPENILNKMIQRDD